MRTSLLIFKTKPIAIYIAISDEPPCEKNGSGTPVFGIILVATPRLMKVCTASQLATPTQIRFL